MLWLYSKLVLQCTKILMACFTCYRLKHDIFSSLSMIKNCSVLRTVSISILSHGCKRHGLRLVSIWVYGHLDSSSIFCDKCSYRKRSFYLFNRCWLRPKSLIGCQIQSVLVWPYFLQLPRSFLRNTNRWVCLLMLWGCLP